MPKANEPTTELVVTAEQLLGHPYDRDWVIQEARQSLADHNRSGIQLGLCLIALRQQEEQGNYDKALKRIGCRGAPRTDMRAWQSGLWKIMSSSNVPIWYI